MSKDKEQNPESSALSRLLQLESMARAAATPEALQFLLVNETRHLLAYRHAYLFLSLHPIKRDCELVAASSISFIDKNATFVKWLEHTIAEVFNNETIDKQKQINIADCPENLKAGWKEFSLPFVLWTPLQLPDGTFIGGLWLSRETSWKENEMALCKRLNETYAHALVALTGRKKLHRTPMSVRMAAWITVLLLLVAFAKPIRLSALAPAEVVPQEPVVVSAPINGVIADIAHSPNTYVAQGTTIFYLEDTELRNQYIVAEKTLAVAQAEYRKATQGAFQDAKSKAQIAYLKAQTELNDTELQYARELLDRVEVKAEKSGILIYSDKSDWIGRPVQVGERLMEIADPGDVNLKINLPVEDAIVLFEGADVDVFLDADPLKPLSAVITRTGYKAEKSDQDILTYRVYAKFRNPSEENLRIGLQGTAKVYGERVSLFFYLFRRPISFVRQLLGI